MSGVRRGKQGGATGSIEYSEARLRRMRVASARRAFTRASPVVTTKADGSVETTPAYTRKEIAQINRAASEKKNSGGGKAQRRPQASS